MTEPTEEAVTPKISGRDVVVIVTGILGIILATIGGAMVTLETTRNLSLSFGVALIVLAAGCVAAAVLLGMDG